MEYSLLSSYLYGAEQSLFRFEGLQEYGAQEHKDRIDHFLKTGGFKIKPARIRWWRAVREKNKKGIVTARVCLDTKPHTDYQKMRRAWDSLVADFSGDGVCSIGEKDFKKIAPEGLPDFWIIDDRLVVIMDHDERGVFTNARIARSSEIDRFFELKKQLLEASEPMGKAE